MSLPSDPVPPDDLFEHFEEASARPGTAGAIYALALAGLYVAGAGYRIAGELQRLGTGDAASTMGAIEFLGAEVGKGFAALATTIEEFRHAL